MRPVDVVLQWIDAFNRADVNALADMYTENAVNHQVPEEPVFGRKAIAKMFADEFAKAQMVCIRESIFEDGNWVIFEWKDPKGLRGCGFFKIVDDKIEFQRGYWDKLTFQKLYNIPEKG